MRKVKKKVVTLIRWGLKDRNVEVITSIACCATDYIQRSAMKI